MASRRFEGFTPSGPRKSCGCIFQKWSNKFSIFELSPSALSPSALSPSTLSPSAASSSCIDSWRSKAATQWPATPNTASHGAYRHAWCSRRPATPAHQQDWTKECRPWHCHHQAPLLRSWRDPRLRARKRASDSCGSGKTATPAHQQDWRTEHHPWHYHHQAPLLRSWPNPRSKAARKCCRHPCRCWISRVISQYTKQ